MKANYSLSKKTHEEPKGIEIYLINNKINIVQ